MTQADLHALYAALFNALARAGTDNEREELGGALAAVSKAILARSAVLFQRAGNRWIVGNPETPTMFFSDNPTIERLHWLVANPDCARRQNQ